MYKIATIFFLLLFLKCEAKETIAIVLQPLFISANKGKGLGGYMKVLITF